MRGIAGLAFSLQKWYTKLMSSVQSAVYQRGVGRPQGGERFECMECKQALGLIVAFINEQINDEEEMKAFLEHVETCAECREELEVTYSLMTAMRQLDEDTDLSDDYIADLNHKIEECYLEGLRKKRSRKRRRIVLAVLIFLLVFLNGITVMKKRNDADECFVRSIENFELNVRLKESP